MKTILVILILMLSFVPMAGAQCVSESQVMEIWGQAMNHWQNEFSMGPVAMTLECNACKCPSGPYSEADCYALKERQERARADRMVKAMEIFERAKKEGICR
jgi:hypothetical protein